MHDTPGNKGDGNQETLPATNTESLKNPETLPKRSKKGRVFFVIMIVLALLIVSSALRKLSDSDADTDSSNHGSSSKVSNGNSSSDKTAVSPDTLPIPSSATVLTLSGLNLNLTNNVPKAFQGIFAKKPYSIEKVDYPASFASDSISTGVKNLDKAIRSTDGAIIVLAHSQGAQVASRWMREHREDTNAPSAGQLTFILFGNPLRSDGGGYIIGRKEVGGTTGKPTPMDTPWTIIDVSRRYEGWSDWVKDESNKIAVENANIGKFTYHSDYSDVDIRAETNTVWRKKNTFYVLTREILPIADKRDYPSNVETTVRAHVETAYDRPPNDPDVKVVPVKDSAWIEILESLGIKNR